MKKLFVIYTCIMTIVCIALVAHIVVMNREYEDDLETLWRNYETENIELLNETHELSIRVNALEEQVWNILNGNDYEVTIEHEGATHTYVREYDRWGITSKDSHHVIY